MHATAPKPILTVLFEGLHLQRLRAGHVCLELIPLNNHPINGFLQIPGIQTGLIHGKGEGWFFDFFKPIF